MVDAVAVDDDEEFEIEFDEGAAVTDIEAIPLEDNVQASAAIHAEEPAPSSPAPKSSSKPAAAKPAPAAEPAGDETLNALKKQMAEMQAQIEKLAKR